MSTTTDVIIPPDDPLPPPPDRTLIAPDKIAADFVAGILANATLAAAYNVTQYGATLYIEKKDTSDFTPYVQDTLDNTGITIVKGSVTGADQLPDQAPEGLRMEVTGDPSTKVDDYWMVFSGGHWTEAASPGVQTAIDGSLMPWRLTSTGTGAGRSFTFGPAEWTDRSAGDDTSNPLPPLDNIDTLFVTEGRLGFTNGPNVVTSASNKPLQIFRSTVAQLLPSDPVAVRSTLGNVGRYHAVIQWDGATQLWSAEAQRAFYGQPAITPTTVALAPTSAFTNDQDCLPVVAGTKVYFTRVVNGAVRVFEYSRPPGYDSLPEVNELTGGIPTFIAGSARMLAVDESLGFIAVVLQGTSNTLYVCNLRQGQNGTVPVWHRWTFNGSIVAATMLGNALLLFTERSGNLYLETLDVANAADTSTPVVDNGGTQVVPSVRYDAIYVQDQTGPDATARVTLRNLTVFQKATTAGSLTFTDETDPRVSFVAPIAAGPIRIPALKRLDGTGFTLSWTGFISTIELQGTFVSRSPRK